MRIDCIVSDFLECNIYLFRKHGYNIMIDCGGSVKSTEKKLKDIGFWPDIIILTHGHFDHISALPLFNETATKIYIAESEKFFLTEPDYNLSSKIGDNEFSYEGEVFALESLPKEIGISYFSSPGHTSGSHCFLCENNLFTGDTLFCAGIGAVHFPTGNVQEEKESLRHIFTLPREIVVYPGHGKSTTIGDESDRYSKYL